MFNYSWPKKDDIMEIRIEKYRKSLGLSKYRLEKKVGISRTSINKLETGKTITSLKTANDIAKVFGSLIPAIIGTYLLVKDYIAAANHLE